MTPRQTLLEKLKKELPAPVEVAVGLQANEITVSTPAQLLVETCLTVRNAANAGLMTMVGNDEREIQGGFGLYYLFADRSGDRLITVKTALAGPQPAFNSLTPYVPAANWYEREVKDLLGLTPVGHPDPRRLVLHENWPRGVHPLRKDFQLAAMTADFPRKFSFPQVEGEGVFEIPVGPIHAGIIEPGHFRFAAVGEAIINLEARLFYTHRGLEKQVEGLDIRDALLVAERVCGVCSFAHSTAYCQALEKIAHAELPVRAKLLRTLFLELERVYNHIGDVGNICAGIGFAFGSSHGSRLKETCQRLITLLCGNRYLRGLNTIGGLTKDLTNTQTTRLMASLEAIAKDFRDLVAVLTGSAGFVDRLRGTGVLKRSYVEDLGVVGPAARASGVDRDCRRDHPHAGYQGLDFKIPVLSSGDVEARFKIRIAETEESLALIRQVLQSLEPGPVLVKVEDLPAYAYACGLTESPRGENVHWVMTGPANTIYRYRVRSASFCNWPAVPLAVPGNIVPDFPLINKSFELCYSCLDR